MNFILNMSLKKFSNSSITNDILLNVRETFTTTNESQLFDVILFMPCMDLFKFFVRKLSFLTLSVLLYERPYYYFLKCIRFEIICQSHPISHSNALNNIKMNNIIGVIPTQIECNYTSPIILRYICII